MTEHDLDTSTSLVLSRGTIKEAHRIFQYRSRPDIPLGNFMLCTRRIEKELILDGESIECNIRLLILEDALVPSQPNVLDKEKRKMHQRSCSAAPFNDIECKGWLPPEMWYSKIDSDKTNNPLHESASLKKMFYRLRV